MKCALRNCNHTVERQNYLCELVNDYVGQHQMFACTIASNAINHLKLLREWFALHWIKVFLAPSLGEIKYVCFAIASEYFEHDTIRLLQCRICLTRAQSRLCAVCQTHTHTNLRSASNRCARRRRTSTFCYAARA